MTARSGTVQTQGLGSNVSKPGHAMTCQSTLLLCHIKIVLEMCAAATKDTGAVQQPRTYLILLGV